ncbi:MAG: lysophospholipid acyltransferase family protein, partial [Terriglobales bacterium]
TVAFTIDGPKGPKYVAKPGPVLLAKVTGAPLVAFHIAIDNPWILKTWDGCMIPKPFSRAFMRVSGKIMVPSNADDGQMEGFHSQLQMSLDRVREFAEAKVRSAVVCSSCETCD